MKTKTLMVTVLVSLFTVVLVCSPAYAQNVGNYNVSGGITSVIVQASIQAAVDFVSTNTNNACIRISTNTFVETVVVSNRNITFEGGYESNLWTRSGAGISTIDGGTAGTTLWFMDSTSYVDRVSLVGGVGEMANSWSGGGCLLHRSWVNFSDSPIFSNTAWNGGGLFVGQFAYAKLEGSSSVFSNSVLFNGGGIYVDGRLDIVSEDADVYGNIAYDSNGGGIYVNSGYLRLFQGDVYDNIAVSGTVNGSSSGGGIALNAASFIETGDNASVSNNTADTGGGLIMISSTATLGRARVADFRVENNGAALAGGGIFAASCQIACSGTVWSGNAATTDGGGLHLWNSTIDSDTNFFRCNNNSADGLGGGMYLAYGSTAELYTVEFGNESGNGNRAGTNGGAVFTDGSDLLIFGGLFCGNTASNPAAGAGLGGGIAAVSSLIFITNGPGHGAEYVSTAMASNHANYAGGAIHSISSTIYACNVEFLGNSSSSNGGAIFMTNSIASLHDSLFITNRASEYGGGICCIDDDQLYVYNCQFINNAAPNNYSSGGGIYVSDAFQVGLFASDSPFYAPPDEWKLLFRGNTANSGAAMTLANSPSIIQNAAIISNVARHAPVYIVGSYYPATFSDPHLSMANSLLANNEQVLGMGAMNFENNATGIVFSCTIVSNLGYGIHLRNSNCNVTVSNTIVWGNTHGSISTNETPQLIIDYCDIAGGFAGTANIDTNPLFYVNYHLRYGSPCINAGAPLSVDYDIDGELRSGNYDIGFDEFIDSDNDRLPDVVETGTSNWVSEIDTGTEPDNPETDGDGVNDGDECVATTNPNDINSYLHIISIQRQDGSNVIVWAGGTNANQDLESCQSPENAVWTSVTHLWAPTPGTNRYSEWIGPLQTQKTYRVRIDH